MDQAAAVGGLWGTDEEVAAVPGESFEESIDCGGDDDAEWTADPSVTSGA